MKRIVTCLYGVVTCGIFFTGSLFCASAITYDFNNGRFGDCLTAYCHGKVLSLRYNIPLLYRSFLYSDQLTMHNQEIPYRDGIQKNFRNTVIVTNTTQIDPTAHILYIVPYFPACEHEANTPMYAPYYFPIPWHDNAILQELRAMIHPINALLAQPLALPANHVCIAIHIRVGTGWDEKIFEDYDKRFLVLPFKFVSAAFYAEQLKKICALHHDQALFVYLFTDHTNPAELADFLKKEANHAQLHVAYRAQGNKQDANVLDDFFALMYTPFDYFIRSDSYFALMASLLGYSKTIISPKHYIIKDNRVIIDEVTVYTKK